jgi:hypothetical protein
MRSIMSKPALDALEFMISPAEGRFEGIPDGAVSSSFNFLFRQDGVQFSRPGAWSDTQSWNLTLVMMPSIDYPVYAMYSKAEYLEMPWGALKTMGQNILADDHYGATTFNWSAFKEVDIAPGTLAAGLRAPQGIMPSTLVTEGLSGYVDLTKRNWFQAVTTDSTWSVTDFRLGGFSITTEQTANALTDEGLVYSWQFPRTVKSRTVTANSILHTATIATPPVYSSGVGSITANAYTLAGLPYSVADLSQIKHYRGQAKHGNYVVSHYHGNSHFRSCIGEAGLVVYDNPLPNTNQNTIDELIEPIANQRTVTVDGIAHTFPAPIYTAVDDSWSPIIVTYQGLNATAKITAKFTMGVEAVADSTGQYSSMMVPSLEPSLAFRDLASPIQSTVEPGYPASANWIAAILSTVGRSLWSIVKYTAPIWLNMLGKAMAD